MFTDDVEDRSLSIGRKSTQLNFVLIAKPPFLIFSAMSLNEAFKSFAGIFYLSQSAPGGTLVFAHFS